MQNVIDLLTAKNMRFHFIMKRVVLLMLLVGGVGATEIGSYFHPSVLLAITEALPDVAKVSFVRVSVDDVALDVLFGGVDENDNDHFLSWKAVGYDDGAVLREQLSTMQAKLSSALAFRDGALSQQDLRAVLQGAIGDPECLQRFSGSNGALPRGDMWIEVIQSGVTKLTYSKTEDLDENNAKMGADIACLYNSKSGRFIGYAIVQ